MYGCYAKDFGDDNLIFNDKDNIDWDDFASYQKRYASLSCIAQNLYLIVAFAVFIFRLIVFNHILPSIFELSMHICSLHK